MKRLDRYIVREMVVPFLIGQGAVVLMLTGTVLYNNANVFINYNIPAIGVAKVAFYFLPYLIHLTMPVAMAVAASLTVSRLARDSEITAIRAAGVSLKRIFLPVFMVGAFLSVADFYFGEHVVPWSNREYEKTMAALSRQIKFLVPQDRQVVQSPDKKFTAYVGRMELQPKGNKAHLYDVMFLVSTTPGMVASSSTPMVVLAERGQYDNGKWTLYDARIHNYRNHGVDETFVRSKFWTADLRLSEQTFNLIALQLPLYSSSAANSFEELGKRIQMQKRIGWNNPRDLLDYHFKLSVPFSCLVFAIACPPLSLRFAKAGNFMGVLLSIILVFVYWNTLLAAKIVGASFPQQVSPIMAAWGQNVLFALIGLFVLWKSE